MQTLPPSNQDVNGINWLPLKVLVACKLTNRFAWPDTDYRIKIADLNFPHYLPKAFEVHIEIVWLYLLFFSKPPKAELPLLKLTHFFAREVLLVKKLKIKETKTT